MKPEINICSIILVIGFIFQINAQEMKEIKVSFLAVNEIENSSFNVKQVIKIFDEIGLVMMPQFDGLFSKILNKRIQEINTKNYFMEFDFGLNFGLNYKLADVVNLGFIYNIGLMKLDPQKLESIKRPNLKLSLNYTF